MLYFAYCAERINDKLIIYQMIKMYTKGPVQTKFVSTSIKQVIRYPACHVHWNIQHTNLTEVEVIE